MLNDPVIRLQWDTIEWRNGDNEPRMKGGWAEAGGWRYGPKEKDKPAGCTMLPDAYDQALGLSATDLAVNYITRQNVCYRPSDDVFSPGTFYSGDWADLATGVEEQMSCHLDGFSLVEEAIIFAKVTGRSLLDVWAEIHPKYKEGK